MADLFAVTSETGVGINTDAVKNDGQNIFDYGTQLSKLLEDFEGVMTTLTSHGMQGYMSDQALSSYQKVKDSLDEYAKSLIKTGSAVQQSAEDLSTANMTAGDNISVFN